jgi:adenosylhomocysteine nucleosidase
MEMLGVMGAMKEEVAALKAALNDRSSDIALGYKVFKGYLNDVPLLLVQAGVGKVNAAMATIALANAGASRIVFTGMAGGLGPEVRIGDVVVATGCVQHDFDLFGLDGTPAGLIPGEPERWVADEALSGMLAHAATELGVRVHHGVVASGDQFIADHERSRMIYEQFGALACEMEGAAVAQVCNRLGIPFGVLRWISDAADSAAIDDFPAFVGKIADLDLAVIRQLVAQ